MIIYLATESVIKQQAVRSILQQFTKNKLLKEQVELIGKDIDSNMPLTPYNKETFLGAKNRATKLRYQFKNCGQIYVGLESGLVKRYNHLYEECWCFITDDKKNEYFGYSSGYLLPGVVSNYLKNGGEHIDIMKKLENKYNISGKDTWAIYTKNIISRNVSIEEAFRNTFAAYLIKHKQR